LEPYVEGFDTKNVKASSYELCLGDEAYVTRPESSTESKLSLSTGDRISIHPGQIAALLTQETIHLPNNVLGFISIKFQFKKGGLVNVSGFHVDPGYDGKLLFLVYNAGPRPIVLSRGRPTFMLWVCSLEEDTDTPYGSEGDPGTQHTNAPDGRSRSSISDEEVMALHGTVLSPQALAARLERVEKRVRAIAWSAAAVVVPIAIGVIVDHFDSITHWIGNNWPL
jgi:dCTP deaminase